MMWLTVRCTEEISVSALAKLAFAITDAAHRETGVPIALNSGHTFPTAPITPAPIQKLCNKQVQ